MPCSLEDVKFAQCDHKAGLKHILSRAGGWCFIKGMALDDKKKVQGFVVHKDEGILAVESLTSRFV